MKASKNTDEPEDNSIKHGSYNIKRPGARISLNDNDSQFDHDKTEVTVMASKDDIGSPPGVLLQATFSNGGLLEAYAGLTMTPKQAWEIGTELQKAAKEMKK